MQFRKIRLPATEHRPIICSTKLRGNSAASSAKAPAAVMPCSLSWALSLSAPNRWYRFVPICTTPADRRCSQGSPRVSSIWNMGASTFRVRAPVVTPARMKSWSEKTVWLHRRKERIITTVFPDRMAPSASIIRQCSFPLPGCHQ